MTPKKVATPRPSGLKGRNGGDNSGFPMARDFAVEGTVFKPTYPVDQTFGITNWGMLGNGPDPSLVANGGNPVGDCTYCGRQHYRMAKAAWGKITETWQTSDSLVEEYLAYNHGQDIGADIPSLLLHWYKLNIIEGFVKLDITNRAEIDWACQTFHGVYCGGNMTDDVDQLFQQGQPWTTAQGQQPDPNQGHCIVLVGSTTKQDTWVTWGALQKSTKAWTTACIDEAYAIVTREDAYAVDITALKAAIESLPGYQQHIYPHAPQPSLSVMGKARQWLKSKFVAS